MNHILIDNSLLAASLLIAVIVSKTLKDRKTGILFSTILLFSPLITFLNMWAHTFAVSIVNARRYFAGTFQYNFAFYSLLLFGVVFIVMSGFAIHYSKKYITGDKGKKRSIYLFNLLILLSFLPVVFINPLASLPIIAAIISSVTLIAFNPYKSKTLYKKPEAKTDDLLIPVTEQLA